MAWFEAWIALLGIVSAFMLGRWFGYREGFYVATHQILQRLSGREGASP